MAADKLLSLYGLKFNPFRSGVPAESLYVTPVVNAFCRRVELTITDGGFALVTGEPGTGKSGALRVIAHRLAQLPDVTVRTIDRPQSGVSDFYREIGELYGINLRSNNRWGGFKALRTLWANHISQSLTRPILIIDESQQMLDNVFSELRLLSSKDFDSRSLLCVIFAGDQRLLERLKVPRAPSPPIPHSQAIGDESGTSRRTTKLFGSSPCCRRQSSTAYKRTQTRSC